MIPVDGDGDVSTETAVAFSESFTSICFILVGCDATTAFSSSVLTTTSNCVNSDLTAADDDDDDDDDDDNKAAPFLSLMILLISFMKNPSSKHTPSASEFSACTNREMNLSFSAASIQRVKAASTVVVRPTLERPCMYRLRFA